jgi:predicted permease
MDNLLAGAVIMGSAVVALYFLRFWHRTRDHFFLLFAASFGIEAGNRVALALLPYASEDEPVFYLVRLLAYGLILVAFWQKNRARR